MCARACVCVCVCLFVCQCSCIHKKKLNWNDEAFGLGGVQGIHKMHQKGKGEVEWVDCNDFRLDQSIKKLDY